MSPKVEINLDSTGLSDSHCNLKVKYTLIDGLYLPMSAVAVYGIGVHKFTDVMFKTNGHIAEATRRGVEAFNMKKEPPEYKQDHLMDPKHFRSTCYNFWTLQIEEDKNFEILKIPTKCYWCKGTGFKVNGLQGEGCSHCNGIGKVEGAATELTFKIKIYEDDYIIVYLCGTIDSVGKITNGCYAIRDIKTTSTPAYKQKKYLEQYRLSKQLRIYTLACKLEAKNHPESILGRIGATRMGAFIDAIFLKPSSNDNEYARSEVYQFSDDEIEVMHQLIIQYCEQISARVERNHWDKEGIRNGTCTGNFGHCKYWALCSNNEQVATLIKQRHYKIKKYDPLNFNEGENETEPNTNQ